MDVITTDMVEGAVNRQLAVVAGLEGPGPAGLLSGRAIS
jgi:hypothetical protein